MTDYADLALLPEGLHDELPPAAAYEAEAVERLLSRFAAHGYDRVDPPLIEFESSLLAGPGARVARHTFRLMDPISQRMMGLRADMTTQVARVAMSRLRRLPRPLRLCYAGQVLRVRGTQLRPLRQFAQAGLEFIGADRVECDVEVLLIAAEALRELGVARLSVDLTIPGLVPALCESFAMPEETAAALREAMAQKDRAALESLPAPQRRLLAGLLEAAGRADKALAQLRGLALPKSVQPMVQALEALVTQATAEDPALTLTLDPAESRGFEYESGASFTFFAKGVRGELGRGGRYELANGEAATGFTLYLDSVMRGLPKPSRPQKLYLPFEAAPDLRRAMRDAGWRTVRGMRPGTAARDEAVRLGCTHYHDGEAVREIA